MTKVSPKHDGAYHYAKSLPDSAWHPGYPVEINTFYAVKTETGRILTGRGMAFCRRNILKIEAMSKYGKVVGYVEIGD